MSDNERRFRRTTPRDRGAYGKEKTVIRHSMLLLISALSLNAFAADDWVPDGQVTDFYVWRTLPASEVAKVCRLALDEARPDGGCAPVRLVGGDAVVPAEARRMSGDAVIGERTRGRVCWVYSTLTWGEAAWRGNVEEQLSHLDHEKRHCAGFSHRGPGG